MFSLHETRAHRRPRRNYNRPILPVSRPLGSGQLHQLWDGQLADFGSRPLPAGALAGVALRDQLRQRRDHARKEAEQEHERGGGADRPQLAARLRRQRAVGAQ